MNKYIIRAFNHNEEILFLQNGDNKAIARSNALNKIREHFKSIVDLKIRVIRVYE